MKRSIVLLAMIASLLSVTFWLTLDATPRTLAAVKQPPPDDISPLELEMQNLPDVPSTLGTAGEEMMSVTALDEVHVMPAYFTVPDILQRIIVTKGNGTLGDGYYFISLFGVDGAASRDALYIVDENAQLIYYDFEPGNRRRDIDVHSDGTIAYFNEDDGTYEVLDSTYTLSKIWKAGNGHPRVDGHEYQVLQNGNIVLMVYHDVARDLSGVGGLANARVIDLVIQEINQNDEVVFEWNSKDHFAITDTFVALDTELVDYAHGNAIAEDFDGNFLISNRHMSEITKIDRTTGEIIWRLGGKNNEFTFIGDDTLPEIGGFSYQHDVRRLPNGNISIFDNANQFIDAEVRGSRGVEYAIDEISKTVTLVREFRTSPDTLAGFMGSMQRLENNNTVVGWGGGIGDVRRQPHVLTEFDPDGEPLLHLGYLDTRYLSYRARKRTWQGFPTYPPTLVYADTEGGALYYSWNGATEVLSYTVLGGDVPTMLNVIAQQPKTGFEDSTPLAALDPNLCFFQVVPSMKPGADALPSALLYRGDASCPRGLVTDNSTSAARDFTIPQSGGKVTTTITLNPGDFAAPTVVLFITDTVSAASVPPEQYMSDVHFALAAFEGASYSETTTLAGETLLTVAYGEMDLSRTPADVNVLRWDEATQSWTSEGLRLLARDVVVPNVTYQVEQTGEFALFVANNAPQSGPASAFISEDTTLTFTNALLPFFDLDGDPFATLVVETLPATGTLALNGAAITTSQTISASMIPQLTFAPAADQFGTPYATFDFRVGDGFTTSVPYSFTIAVGPVNDPPVAVDDLVDSLSEPPEGHARALVIPIAVLENDTDVDGDTLRITSVSTPAQGFSSIVGDEVVYTSGANFTGSDTFTYTVTDGHGGEATATVTIQVPFEVDKDHTYFLPRIGQ